MVRARVLLPESAQPFVKRFGFRVLLQTELDIGQRIHRRDQFRRLKAIRGFANPYGALQQRFGLGLPRAVAVDAGQRFDGGQALRIPGLRQTPLLDGAL
jgi:hypothetical protein